MSQYKIIETNDELDKQQDCIFYTLEGEIHLTKIVKCYDGDTVHCIFKHDGQYKKFHMRLYGYDSYEMKPSKQILEPKRTELKNKAIMAKTRLESLILNKNVYLYCLEFDKYGRILGNIKINKDDLNTVNDIMINEDHGYPYFGGTKKQAESEE